MIDHAPCVDFTAPFCGAAATGEACTTASSETAIRGLTILENIIAPLRITALYPAGYGRT
jgi:hypothetical protein